MNTDLLARLRRITPEEEAILDGRSTIDRGIYMQGHGNTINAEKLLASGKLITLRTHTRFIHFPEHRHDYVEVVYMCAGQTSHIVNGKELTLREGEILFLSQSCTHEVLRAGERDVAVNFIVLPEFFNTALVTIGEEQTPLRQFLVDCLSGRNEGPGFLHFQTSDIVPVRNLAENLIYILLTEVPNKRKSSQMTMALLFLVLMGHTDTLETENQEEADIFRVLQYVEQHYADGSLADLAEKLHYDVSWLSREIKRKTGKNYTQLLQEKRLAQAAFLLKTTDRKVSDIATSVGYENISYFHRIFASAYGRSPKHYRDGA